MNACDREQLHFQYVNPTHIKTSHAHYASNSQHVLERYMYKCYFQLIYNIIV